MAFVPDIQVGQILSNSELKEVFGVGNMGGMRKSNANNCLVVISDHTKGLYDDRWIGGVLHYTGMGKEGDQNLDYAQNATLNASRTNGVTVFLFEVWESGRYEYRGIASLVQDPYQEEQHDVNKMLRKVWMFPLSVEEGAPRVAVTALEGIRAKKSKDAAGMSLEELREHAKASPKQCSKVSSTSDAFVRSAFVVEYAKRVANGVCQLCGNPAPFLSKDGKPYLETHHVRWLSRGGDDSIENVVALCSNCHSKMHVLDDPNDVALLEHKALVNLRA